MIHDSCEGCRHDLGGGCCRINEEQECREGGEYELFEAAKPVRCEYCQCGDDGTSSRRRNERCRSTLTLRRSKRL